MSFAVEPADLDGCAKLVSRAGDDIDSGIDFMQKNANIEDSFGDLWQTVYGSHQEHLDGAKKCLNGFKRILDASSNELNKSAKYYRTTDEEQARNVDATYPRSKPHRSGDAKGTKGPSSNFADKEDATSHLKAPGGDDGYVADWAGEFEAHPFEKGFGTLLDFASPSATTLEFIKAMTGWDPLGDFVNWSAGDWESFLNCADVWGSLADLSAAISRNIKAGNIELDASWQGNSADAAYAYFDELGDKLLSLEETFNSLKDNYFEISGAVYAFGEFYKGMIVDVLDLGLKALLNFIAGDAALATGVGAAAAAPFYAMSALQIVRVMERWGEATERLGQAMKIASVATGAIQGTLGVAFKTVNNFPVPGSGYDNQAV
ncbi:type VII secretion target [Streptomyces sp. N2A]|uniref:type VII secretion target n=1 Tax=Streptomyces sp. N2A TaxID=3073936 RepID=UPI00287080DF|nr:type VII secretion target [Streptomyces sp. N2A]